MRRADASCCLTGIGSINTPKCRVMKEMEDMGKKDWLRRMQENDRSCAGKSLVEIMEGGLDDVVEDIMYGFGEEDPLVLKGKALGIAECISIIRSPYLPNVEVIREEAMVRFHEHNPNFVEVEDD